MADDLSQFFAKKAAKSKDKKKKVKVSVDDVGQVLERKAKRQEERDRENEDVEKRAQEEATFFEKRTEDSEWLEFKDTNKEIILEELGIRDMNLTEQVDEAIDEEKSQTTEAPKTWNKTTTEKKEPEESITPPKPAIWRPRHLVAQNAFRTGVAPNIADQEMFPTFEDAEKIEKLKKDDEKKRKNDGFTTVTSDRDTSSGGGSWAAAAGGSASQRASSTPTSNAWHRSSQPATSTDRAALFSAVKQVTSGGAPNPIPPSSQQATPKNPNVYVPPSRRRAAEPMQAQ